MITSFACKATRKIWKGDYTRRFHRELQIVARRKLRMLNNATNLNDLTAAPGNRLEAMSGDRAGQFSIRVNQQWRVCFCWSDGQATDVELVDYHGG